MENDAVKAIVLLDDVSRGAIKCGVASWGSYGIKFINSLDEFNDEAAKHSKDVVIFEGFLTSPSCLSDMKLYKVLYDINYFFVGSKSCFSVVNGLANCFEADLGTLDISIIQAALFHDVSHGVQKKKEYFSYKEAAEGAVDNPESSTPEMVGVSRAYLALCGIQKFLNEEDALLRDNISRLEDENAKLILDMEQLLQGYKDMIRESYRLNRSLERYEAAFTKDVYDKVNLSEYDNKPFILYFKEFEDFINIDAFIDTLAGAFKLQDRKNVKVLRLFDSHTSRKMQVVPSHYHVIRNRYTLSEVSGHDLICKSGDYRRLLDRILTNDIGADVLIIVDHKSFDDVVTSGAVLHFNLCREDEHAKKFGLNTSNTIVNFGGDGKVMLWEDYDVLGMEQREKFVFLSSRPVIRQILSLSRIFINSQEVV